ncbi:MAG: DUF2178 domain-containing protein [Alphaproteobacteria bacterium]|nr:DUF2178 domain-containing protein [Alphaproteobacteria bacterium]
MAEQEKYSWLSLIATGLIVWFFAMRMMDGWQIVDVPPRHLFWTYVALIVATIVAETAIHSALAIMRKGERVIHDERDKLIEDRADRNQHVVIIAVINVIVFHMIAEAAFPGYEFVSADLTRLPALVTFLLGTLYAGHIVKLISTILSYRM